MFAFRNIPNSERRSVSGYGLHSTAVAVDQTTREPDDRHFCCTLDFPLFLHVCFEMIVNHSVFCFIVVHELRGSFHAIPTVFYLKIRQVRRFIDVNGPDCKIEFQSKLETSLHYVYKRYCKLIKT